MSFTCHERYKHVLCGDLDDQVFSAICRLQETSECKVWRSHHHYYQNIYMLDMGMLDIRFMKLPLVLAEISAAVSTSVP